MNKTITAPAYKDHADPPGALAQMCRPVAGELDRIRTLMRDQVRIDHPQLEDLSLHIVRYGGKMLRPALLLLAGKVIGKIDERHVKLGAVVELLHQATLVHDDVLDHAKVRRKRPTTARLWGNEASVLLGDYLLSRVFDLCNRTGDPRATELISETAEQICRGELLQCINRRYWQLSEQQYLDIIARKTASLYQLCCYLGGSLSGAGNAQLDALSDYGRAVGSAFQIVDDVLDICSTEDRVGKTLGRDLAQAKPTLPIIHCLHHGRDRRKSQLLDLLNTCAENEKETDEKTTGKILALLDAENSLEYSWDKARRFSAQAVHSLDVLTPGPAREAMRMIAGFVVDRSC